LALTNAQDVLEFKLKQVCEDSAFQGVEGRRRAVDEVLRIIALGPELTRSEDQLRHELMMTRIAQRFGVREETLWGRMRELRAARKTEASPPQKKTEENTAVPPPVRQAPAKKHEQELIGILLSEPRLVAELRRHLPADEIEHPGLRLLLATMYRVVLEGETPSLDHLRARIDNQPLLAKAVELQEKAHAYTDRQRALDDLIRRFAEIRETAHKQQIQQQLHAAEDHESAMELLRELQKRTES
jgi:hypothetical protein